MQKPNAQDFYAHLSDKNNHFEFENKLFFICVCCTYCVTMKMLVSNFPIYLTQAKEIFQNSVGVGKQLFPCTWHW